MLGIGNAGGSRSPAQEQAESKKEDEEETPYLIIRRKRGRKGRNVEPPSLHLQNASVKDKREQEKMCSSPKMNE